MIVIINNNTKIFNRSIWLWKFKIKHNSIRLWHKFVNIILFAFGLHWFNAGYDNGLIRVISIYDGQEDISDTTISFIGSSKPKVEFKATILRIYKNDKGEIPAIPGKEKPFRYKYSGCFWWELIE